MPNGDDWTIDELQASVSTYLEMLKRHRQKLPFTKRDYYRDLANRFGRSEGAFEYRAQNISHVLALLGREWLPGLPPAKNVGPKVTSILEGLLATVSDLHPTGQATFEAKVQAARKKTGAIPPAGNQTPRVQYASSSSFIRDPEVKAWVLEAAKGVCECCSNAAPFTAMSGDPYLEVHHVRQLADGGPDTTQNAVAICPNCHRALHYAINRTDLIEGLYKRITRLVR